MILFCKSKWCIGYINLLRDSGSIYKISKWYLIIHKLIFWFLFDKHPMREASECAHHDNFHFLQLLWRPNLLPWVCIKTTCNLGRSIWVEVDNLAVCGWMCNDRNNSLHGVTYNKILVGDVRRAKLIEWLWRRWLNQISMERRFLRYKGVRPSSSLNTGLVINWVSREPLC
jgi:hypothetical protein